MKTILIVLFGASCVWGDAACATYVATYAANGATLVCNVVYDSVTPSGDSLSRTVDIAYPTGMSGSTKNKVVVFWLGYGFMGSNQDPANTLRQGNMCFQAIALGMTCVMPYNTRAAYYVLVGNHNIGDTSTQIQPPVSAGTGNTYWPNLAVSCTNAASQSVSGTIGGTYLLGSYNVIVDPNTASQETVTVTSQSDSCNLTLAHSAYTKNHSLGAAIMVPITQWPAQLNDAMSLYSWLGANLGGGTYPGNPNDLNIGCVSSGCTVSLTAASTIKGTNTVSCSSTLSWWGVNGFVCNSTNAGTNYSFSSYFGVSVPLDTEYMANNSNALAQGAVLALMGCNAASGGTVNCPVYSHNVSPRYFTSGSLSNILNTFMMVGSADTTTPAAMFPTWQTAYNSTNLNYINVASGGHGLDWANTSGITWIADLRTLINANARH